jgi:hypothetical protein
MRILTFGVAPRADCGSNGGIVCPLLTPVGVLDRFALLSDTEPTQMLPAHEEVFKPAVIAHDAVDDASGAAHDLRGQ